MVINHKFNGPRKSVDSVQECTAEEGNRAGTQNPDRIWKQADLWWIIGYPPPQKKIQGRGKEKTLCVYLCLVYVCEGKTGILLSYSRAKEVLPVP